MNVFNNVILARNRQLPDEGRMIETCRSIFKSFNINNLSVCTGWSTDQKTDNLLAFQEFHYSRVNTYQIKRISEITASFSATNSKSTAPDCQQDERGLFKVMFI